jgi:hypothetical protein
MGKALKQSSNPHFRSKYADLGNVMDACLPALNAVGIAVIQPTGEDDYGRYVETRLIHESGDSLSCRVPLIVSKNDMQGYGIGSNLRSSLRPDGNGWHCARR